MTARASAGWYDSGDGQQRYWDGSSWTESYRPAPQPLDGSPTSEAALLPPSPEQLQPPEQPFPAEQQDAVTSSPAIAVRETDSQPTTLPQSETEKLPGWVLPAAIILALVAIAVVDVFQLTRHEHHGGEPPSATEPTATGEMPATPIVPDPAGPPPGATDASEMAAEEVVQYYHQAFLAASCDGIVAVTVPGVFERSIASCEDFELYIANYISHLASYGSAIVNSEIDGDVALVEVHEFFDVIQDDGSVVARSSYSTLRLRYTEDRWLIEGFIDPEESS